MNRKQAALEVSKGIAGVPAICKAIERGFAECVLDKNPIDALTDPALTILVTNLASKFGIATVITDKRFAKVVKFIEKEHYALFSFKRRTHSCKIGRKKRNPRDRKG